MTIKPNLTYRRHCPDEREKIMLSKKIVWKLNIIDLLLLAVIALSICALIYKATWGDDSERRDYEISYVCESVPIEILDGLTEGMECSDYAGGADLGVFKRVDYTVLEDIENTTPTPKPTSKRNSDDYDDYDEEDEDEESSESDVDAFKMRETQYARAVIVTSAEGEKVEHGVNVDGTVILKALKLDLIIGDTVLNVYVSDVK